MDRQPKRLYIYRENQDGVNTQPRYHVAEAVEDLAVRDFTRIVGIYHLIGVGTLRCEPKLTLASTGSETVRKDWDFNDEA
jgi:hypothetical protein